MFVEDRLAGTSCACVCCFRHACPARYADSAGGVDACLLDPYHSQNARLGQIFQPFRHGALWLQISPQGKVLQVLLDPKGEAVATASAATEVNGRLFLGSLMGGESVEGKLG